MEYTEQLSLRLETALDEAIKDRETIRSLWAALRRQGWLTPPDHALVREVEAKLRGWCMLPALGGEWVDRV
jgi:hypothetical protein